MVQFLDVLVRDPHGDDMFREVPILYDESIRLGAKKTIDLGVKYGLSTRAFLLACAVTDGHVWSVDVTDSPYARQKIREWGLADRWTFTIMDDLEFIKTWKEGPVDIVMIDTSHYYEHTLRELEAYSPIVRSGGLIFLHDTIPAAACMKVSEAIIDFLKAHPGKYDYYHYLTVHGLGRLTKKG